MVLERETRHTGLRAMLNNSWSAKYLLPPPPHPIQLLVVLWGVQWGTALGWINKWLLESQDRQSSNPGKRWCEFCSNLSLYHWIASFPDKKTPELYQILAIFIPFFWMLTLWCPEVMPQLRVKYSLLQPASAQLSSFSLAQNMPCVYFPHHHAILSACPKSKQSKTKQSKNCFPLKIFRAAKTHDRLGMAGSDVCGWIGSIFPMGYNKGFILNLDTVQHSL